MNDSADAKLHELRSKTTRELASLISKKLDRGLSFAHILQSDPSHQDWPASAHFRTMAEREFAEVASWMTLLSEASLLDRRRLQMKHAELRQALDQPVVPLRAQAAC